MRVAGIVLGLIILMLCLIPAYVKLDSDYVRTITVDSSEKVEQAVSNAVYDVRSRNFIVTTLDIKYCWVDKTFEIRCIGIDRGNLLRKYRK